MLKMLLFDISDEPRRHIVEMYASAAKVHLVLL